MSTSIEEIENDSNLDWFVINSAEGAFYIYVALETTCSNFQGSCALGILIQRKTAGNMLMMLETTISNQIQILLTQKSLI